MVPSPRYSCRGRPTNPFNHILTTKNTTMTNTTHQELLALSLACKEAHTVLTRTKQRLQQLGYTWHYVDTDFGDPFQVAVHPEYVDLFLSSYDAFAKWDPALNVPEYAVIYTE